MSTPDGRDGWAQTFAKAGYPVYVFDEPNNAISGFEVGKFTDSNQRPRIMLWSNEITWRRWGIGPEPGVPAENTRFPFKHIDQLHASMTPVMGSGSPRGGAGGGSRDGVGVADPKVDALVELLEKAGPATLVLHSASGSTGFEAIRRKPDLVNAIVGVEVTGSPETAGLKMKTMFRAPDAGEATGTKPGQMRCVLKREIRKALIRNALRILSS